MGIRYNASPLPADDIDAARADVRCYLADRPWVPEWESGGLYLYLDKAWRNLQALTGPRVPDGPVRPAFRLVEGDVRHMDGGWWKPHYGIHTPSEVADIADDLALFDEDDVRALLSDPEASRFVLVGSGSYTIEYLRQAQRVTALLRDEGLGMIHCIG